MQGHFDLRDARFRPVIMAADVCARLPDVDLDDVETMLANGMLIGFNIAVDATPRRGTQTDPNPRRELRVLVRSVEHYQGTGGMRALILPFSQIFQLMLPHDKPVITSAELQRSMNCDSGHVINLIWAGLLKIVPGTDWSQGRGCTASVQMASYGAFLKARQL